MKMLSARVGRALTGVAGGALFTAGSCCFIAQSFAGLQWIPIYRAGCGCWVVGCMPYILLSIFAGRPEPLLRCCCSRIPLTVPVQVAGLSCYIAGCILGFLDQVVAMLPSINILFAVGAGCQFLDAAVDTTMRYAMSRKLDVGGAAETIAGVFFCLAAGFGGYGLHTTIVRFGMTCWLIGSLVYLSLSAVEYRQAAREECASPPRPPPVMGLSISIS